MEKEPGSVTGNHVTTTREDLNKHPSRAGKCWTPQEDLYSLLWDASPVFNHIANQGWAVMGLDEDLARTVLPLSLPTLLPQLCS